MADAQLKAPKGTRDIVGDLAIQFERLENTARHIFSRSAYSEIRTPLFESVDLFKRSLGDTSDVVEKEMFSFTDRGERMFALRPEGTAGVVRHYIENHLDQKGGLHRLYYMGPMFRAERPQAGRYRQFYQIGAELFGSDEPSVDAEMVLMAATILHGFGLRDLSLQVNSLGCPACRPSYRDALLAFLQSKESELTDESKKRMAHNPLRVLDSKVDGPKLSAAPVMKTFLCAACREHDEMFRLLLSTSSYPVIENNRLVRGLDYYSRSVFEFVSTDLGAQSAVAAGGRYDSLVQTLGGPPIPAVGFALGVDRVVEAYLKKNLETPAESGHSSKVMVMPLLNEALPFAVELAKRLRVKGLVVPPVQARKKLKSQLALASLENVQWAVIIGEDEWLSKEASLKNLVTREQNRVPLNDIERRLC